MKNLLGFIFITVLVIFVYAFPNYYAMINTPIGYSYSGQASWFDPWDVNVYVSTIKWGQGGHLLLQNNYTTTRHQSFLMYPLYPIIGNLFPKTNPFLLFHSAAVLMGVILMVGIYKLTRVFGMGKRKALLALFLIAIGGGLGGSSLTMTGFTFHSAFQRAHESLGVLLYLISLVFFYKGIIEKKFIFNFISLISFCVLMVIYPFYYLSFGIICGGYLLIGGFREFRDFRGLGINLFFGGMTAVIYFLHLKTNPAAWGILSGVNLSNQNPWEILLGYGILWIFIIWKIRNGRENPALTFLNIWFFVSLFLSFSPLGFARFYLRTLFFPAILLVLLNIKGTGRHMGLPLLILFIFLPVCNFYIFAKRITEVKNNNPWFYIENDTKKALDFLGDYSSKGVLSGYYEGNLIPAFTNNKVYFGHLLQTPNSKEKINNLVNFYSNKYSDEQAREFLNNNKLDFVINEGVKLKYSFLKPVFESGNVMILRNAEKF